MKVLFLDVDGVLNAFGESVDYSLYKRYENTEHWEYGHFFPELVAQLNRVTDTTGAVIVVSSTWRIGKTVEQLRELFKAVGITGEVIGKTGQGGSYDVRRINGDVRGLQIQEWLDANKEVTAYAIVDDDNDMTEEQQSRFVKTKTFIGLTVEAADQLIALLS